MKLDDIKNKLVVIDIGEILCLVNAGIHAGINNTDLITASSIAEATVLRDNAIKKAVITILCDHGLCVLNPIPTITNNIDNELFILLNQNYWLHFNSVVNKMCNYESHYFIDVKCSSSKLLIFLDEIPKGEINVSET